jgi:hypothetical protein
MKITAFSSIALLLSFSLLPAEALYETYGEDPRYTECRDSIASASYLLGPIIHASGFNELHAAPQECGLLFPGRDNYNEDEVVIGEFIAPNCGVCAAACSASYHTTLMNQIQDDEPFTFTSVEMNPTDLAAVRDALVMSVNTGQVCTDWNYCSPQVTVVTQSTSLRQEPGLDGAYYYVPEDPAWGNKCLGRYDPMDGEMKPYGYGGYGPDLCLVKSTTGCNAPDPSNQVPAGTCTLKFNTKTNIEDHFPQEVKGGNLYPGQLEEQKVGQRSYIGDTDYNLWDKETGEDGRSTWSEINSKWNMHTNGCTNNRSVRPHLFRNDLDDCDGIDVQAGVFMSGMCDWTPGLGMPLGIDEGASRQGEHPVFTGGINTWLDGMINAYYFYHPDG